MVWILAALSVFNTILLCIGFILYLRTLKLKELKRSLRNQSMDLTDFLSDLRVHGFGAVRIDPDSIVIRRGR